MGKFNKNKKIGRKIIMNELNQTSESSIAVTGASGHLGRLVIEALLARNLPANRIVALVRDPQKVSDLASRGVEVRRADYTQKDSLEAALTGVNRLLLVSSNEDGQRIPQHKNVVEAARKSGVGFLAYTSISRADTSAMQLVAEHKATEQIIRESGIPFALLRNGWYFENYTDRLASIMEHGAVFGSAGQGRVSAASRADYAEAAAVVLTSADHENKVYELGGDTAFTLDDLAAEISKQTGGEIIYRDLPVEEYAQALIGAGLPEPLARILADADLGLKRGDLLVNSGDLRRLTNRPTTTLTEAVAFALRSHEVE
jgi:NAD(P)H dehydrogenase (quinone)